MRLVSAALLCLVLAATVFAQDQPAPRPTLNDAARLRAQGRAEEALRACQAIVDGAKDDTERAQALLAMANILFNRDRARALECYQKVARLAQAPAAYRQSAWRQIAAIARNEEDPETARDAYRHLLTDFPADPENTIATTLDLAVLELNEGNAREALDLLNRLLKTAEKSPRLPDVYVAIVQARAQSQDFKGAADAARAGWQRFPDRTDLMLTLATCYEQAGQLGEAARVMQDLLVRNPQEHDLFRSLYEISRQAKSLPQLAAWLDKRAQAEPLDIVWLGHLARLHEWEGDAAGELLVRGQLVARRPTDARLLLEAGQVALRMKSLDKAARWLEQAWALEPDNQTLVMLNGEVRLQQGKPDEALALWKQGTRYAPADRQSVLSLGAILTRYELTPEAVKVYLEGRAASGDPRTYALNLGQAYENLPDLPAAVREYALALQPGGRDHSAPTALTRLNRLAEDALARPNVIATLSDLRASGALGTDGLAALVYAQVLAGADPDTALQPLTSGRPEMLTTLLSRIASRLENAGHPEAAAACYLRLLKAPQTPEYAAALTLHVSELQQRRGNWRAALEVLTALDTTGLPPQLGAQVDLEAGDLLLRRARKPAEAISAYNRVLQQQPEGPLALKARWGEADVAFRLGKYDLALGTYRTLLAEGGDEPQQVSVGGDFVPFPGGGRRMRLPGADYVDFQAAEALLRQGKYADAAQAYRKFAAANAASDYANDALERVVLLQRMKEGMPGAAEYRDALIAFDRGDGPHAEALLSGLSGGPLADGALLLLGELRLWQGRSPEALQALDQLLADFPDSPLTPQGLYLAAMSLALTDRPQSQVRLQALTTRFPDSPQAEQAQVILENWARQTAAR